MVATEFSSKSWKSYCGLAAARSCSYSPMRFGRSAVFSGRSVSSRVFSTVVKCPAIALYSPVNSLLTSTKRSSAWFMV
ncbi:hypothetical protein D3C80_2012380 [compost metagenome]